MAILLLAALLASIVALGAATIWFLRGETGRARGILFWWGLGVAVYAASLVAVAALPSGRDLDARGPHCDDDWCMSVESVGKTPSAPGEVAIQVGVRIFSRANRGLRSARGAWLYLTDERGHRFGLERDPAAIPLDVFLKPGESVATSLTFHVPADAREVFFTGGLDGIRYASFIIGNGDLLGKPRIQFRIQ